MEKKYHLGVKALLKNELGQYLLLKVNQEKFLSPKKEEYWDIPGGRVQQGQSVEETLLREVDEETSLRDITNITPFDMTLSNIEIPLKNGEIVGLILSIFKGDALRSQAIEISDEHTDYKWCFSEEAAELLTVKYPASFIQKLQNVA